MFFWLLAVQQISSQLNLRKKINSYLLHIRLIEIKIESVQKINSRIWEKKEGKSAKPLTKIRVTVIFLKEDMRRNVVYCHSVLLQKRKFIPQGIQNH